MTEKETPFEPTLEGEWRQRIQERFGREVRCSADCERLAEDIEARTGEHVGVTSVKRWFGFAGDGTLNIRRSTLDILARFVGFASLQKMELSLGEEFIHSKHAPDGAVDVSRLEPGLMVHITWDPGRDVELEYLGDFRFLVTKAVNSKLIVDDEVRIVQFCKGLKLIVTDHWRFGHNLGPYTGAMSGGITTLEIY